MIRCSVTMLGQDSSIGDTKEARQKIDSFRRHIEELECQVDSGMNTLCNFMSLVARSMRTPGVSLVDLPLAEVEKDARLICKPHGEYELQSARVRLLTKTNGFCFYRGPAMKLTTRADGSCVYESGDKMVILLSEGSWQYSSQAVKIVCKPRGSYFYVTRGLDIHFRSDGFFRCRRNGNEILRLTYKEPDVTDPNSPEDSVDPAAATTPANQGDKTEAPEDIKFNLRMHEVRGYEADEIRVATLDQTLFVQAARKTSDKTEFEKHFELGSTNPRSLRAILTAEGILHVRENPDCTSQDPFTIELPIEHF